MGETASVSGPDFSQGIALGDVPAEGTLAGRVGDEAVLLSRFDGKLFAISGTCTHYGGNLADGIVRETRVHCPLHHACFDLRTGQALRAPALDPLDRWQVEIEADRAFVRQKIDLQPKAVQPLTDVKKIVIVGGGAAGLACAHELRRLGFTGDVTILSADSDPPCDRPNLSKDYLAGGMPEEWLWLRGDDWYSDNRIDLELSSDVASIDPNARIVRCASGAEHSYDRLLLATGSEPNRLREPGFERENVFTLRTVSDVRTIGDLARPGAKVAIVGASFIALEAAAALRKRGAEVTVVSVEEVPLERIFGSEVGTHLQALHERNGVHFHLSSVISAFDGSRLTTADGTAIEADLVLLGIGVRPRTALAQAAGAAVDNGVQVDAFLESSIPGMFAAGDIAAYPDPLSGERVRIEHWAVAEQQGQIAAGNMLGERVPFDHAPFFWTEHFGVTIRYSGRASGWDAVTCEGDFDDGSFIARYFAQGSHCATATIGRDKENLEDEQMLERRARAAREDADSRRK